jgi:biopolymer transport protein ExbD
MASLDLNLPPASKSKPNPNKPKEVNFEVIIRNNAITIADTLGGAIKTFKKSGGEFDYEAINDLLVKIKSRFPEKLNITLLMEQDVKYDTLVKVMDTVRVVTVIEEGVPVKKELFPKISLGDAPPEGKG